MVALGVLVAGALGGWVLGALTGRTDSAAGSRGGSLASSEVRPLFCRPGADLSMAGGVGGGCRREEGKLEALGGPPSFMRARPASPYTLHSAIGIVFLLSVGRVGSAFGSRPLLGALKVPENPFLIPGGWCATPVS